MGGNGGRGRHKNIGFLSSTSNSVRMGFKIELVLSYSIDYAKGGCMGREDKIVVKKRATPDEVLKQEFDIKTKV